MNLPLPFLLLSTLSFVGCQQITIADQPTLFRPVFDFQGKHIHSVEGSLVGQIETGRGTSINASSGGCSSCQ